MNPLNRLLEALAAGNDLAAEEAVTKLSREYTPDVLQALEELYTRANSDLRWWAIRALAVLPLPGNLPTLLSAVDDPDESVRLCAVLGLRENPHPQSTTKLVELLPHPDRLLARLAGDALAAIGVPATEQLLQSVKTGNPASRLEACRALAIIQDPQSISTLFKLLDEDSALLEYWANEGLERMGIGMAFFKSG